MFDLMMVMLKPSSYGYQYPQSLMSVLASVLYDDTYKNIRRFLHLLRSTWHRNQFFFSHILPPQVQTANAFFPG